MALPIVRGVRRWCFLPLPGVPKRSRINIEQHLPELLPRDKSTTGCAIPMRHDGKQYRQQVECSLFGHLQRMAPTVQGPMYIESPLTITAAYKDLSLTGVRYKPPEQLSAADAKVELILSTSLSIASAFSVRGCSMKSRKTS